jgi:hypothetical protein
LLLSGAGAGIFAGPFGRRDFVLLRPMFVAGRKKGH